MGLLLLALGRFFSARPRGPSSFRREDTALRRSREVCLLDEGARVRFRFGGEPGLHEGIRATGKASVVFSRSAHSLQKIVSPAPFESLPPGAESALIWSNIGVSWHQYVGENPGAGEVCDDHDRESRDPRRS